MLFFTQPSTRSTLPPIRSSASGSLTVTAGSSPLSPKDSSKARGTKSEQRISSAIWSTTA